MVLGDVDCDADLDRVVGNHQQQNRLAFNLLRQLDAPLLLRSGRTWQFDV